MSAARKPKGRPPRAEVAAYADMGPRIRHEAAPGSLSARVVSTYRPDPEAPSAPVIRGAKAVIIYEWLCDQGHITDAMREAADRFRTQLERASGAVECRPDASGIRSPGVRTPTEKQVAALADLRAAKDALAITDYWMVEAIVGHDYEPPGGVPLARLRAALQTLAVLWGVE